jgi:hypothetical protein
VRWDGARLVRGDPERLTLYFVGGPPGRLDDPCAGNYEAKAKLIGDRMAVTLRQLRGPALLPGHACDDVGYTRTSTVALHEPLRGRPVVDGATGQERPVSDAALLLTPSWLPPGYRLVDKRVEFGVDRREWGPDGRVEDERLDVEQGDPGKCRGPALIRSSFPGWWCERCGDGLEDTEVRRLRLRFLGRAHRRAQGLHRWRSGEAAAH